MPLYTSIGYIYTPVIWDSWLPSVSQNTNTNKCTKNTLLPGIIMNVILWNIPLDNDAESKTESKLTFQ